MAKNYYYSGQGSLYAAQRDPVTGKPMGFIPVGNVPELTIDIEVDKQEHVESESGSRLTDLILIKAKKGKFKFKLENLDLDNLALGLWGTKATVPGASVAAEALTAYVGKRCPLAHLKVSAVTVSAPPTATFASTTAYALNALVSPIAANGHYYKVTVAGTSGAVSPVWPTDGSSVMSGTVEFTDMGTSTKVLGTDYDLDAANGVITPLATGSIFEGSTLSVAYTYAGFTNLEAFTSVNAPERYLRFEGLNTVDGSRVVVDVLRAQFDPMTGYSLIGDSVSSVDVGGALLADASVVAVDETKFFRQRNIAA